MVSEYKKSALSTFDKHEMKPLAEPMPIRLRFRKTGDLQYISHLDLQRVMSRVLVRSGIPVWYTQGFNPHAKMVFSMPLAVGTQSLCEYLDIKIDKKISTDEILARINSEVTDEMRFSAAYVPKSKLSEIALVSYEIELCAKDAEPEAIEKLLTTHPLMMKKRSKAGDREVDILDYFKSVEVKREENIKLCITLTAGEGSLNPEMIIAALRENLGILTSDDESYTVMRTGVYFADGTIFE